jgi:cyclophilin family peptidyl-prolyl cis-trans isomerase
MLTRNPLAGSALSALCLLSITSLACAEGKATSTATTTASAHAASGASAAPATGASTGKLAAAQSGQSTAALAAPTDELVVLQTSAGEVVIDLFEDKTPGHAENFKKLVRQGWYDGSPFHRVIEGFMAQGGGKWGPGGQPTDVGYTIPAEIVPGLLHHRGSVAAARTGDQVNPERRSSGSQFYICFGDTPNLDGAYTVFGQVVSGMENVDKLVKGDPRSGAMDPAAASTIVKAWLKPKDAATAGKMP